MTQFLGAALVVRGARFCEHGFVIFALAQVECIQRDPLRIQAAKPAPRQRRPYRMTAKVRRYYSEAQWAMPLRRGCMGARVWGTRHESAAEPAIPGEEFTVVFFLIRKLEGLVSADCQGVLHRTPLGEPAFEVSETFGEGSPSCAGIIAGRIHRRQLRHRKGPPSRRMLRVHG